ncbi:uncharacterized protein LOC131882037 isoform X3 [Tigriopus californicus]|uniref:uncharacterized protein LOC131882037 isoform X3 n=1 Tax=Tigriopus californicus TaxID=6832 RepID=UPI0027DA9895|nr:uncharacterized protein LOC131882037 isoform X3 [Tigriopus californicus]
MAFAAARMIMPKDKQRKTSNEIPIPIRSRGGQLAVNRPSRSPSVATHRTGVSCADSFNQNKQGGPPLHPYVPRSASGRPLGKAGGRGCVKHSKTKGKKGKKGKKDQYDLIINIDLSEWQLSDEQVAEFKEVFMLFDKDEDGVLTFPELNVVMKSLGQRPSEKELLAMVRDVSEDQIYDTIEFNEFLQMMSKQQRFGMTEDSLKDAFKIFDKDDDGFISVSELRHIMQGLGEKMTDQELDEMVREADSDNDGLINYKEFVQILCTDNKALRKKKRKAKKKDRRGGTGGGGGGLNGTIDEDPPNSTSNVQSNNKENQPVPLSADPASLLNHAKKASLNQGGGKSAPSTNVTSHRANDNPANDNDLILTKDSENNVSGCVKTAHLDARSGKSHHSMNQSDIKDRNGNPKSSHPDSTGNGDHNPRPSGSGSGQEH